MSQQLSQNIDENSFFRIMISSDNHLGYIENDQIRGDDAFNSFEEVLKVSKNENVDFLLLGGDLFHHHNPSKKTIIRASNILQKHVYGQKEHKFEVYCYEPNFRNENLSIELPIFIIHGNHDDPSGFENFSSIDIFSNKEVNYFGKVNNYEEFDLFPILFVKGNTKIALYGIGNLKDERLYLALQNKKVNFHRPDDFKNWFNILIVHQNRFKGHNIGKSKKNFLPESFIPSFFDLIIWGHEHECFTEPVYNSEVGFHVYQPGSTVVTSLIQAESKHKCCGLLEVFGDRFRIVPSKLENVRPFLFQQFELKAFKDEIQSQEDIEKIIERKIEEMIEEARISRSHITNQDINSNISIPILRLKIEYSGYQMTRTNFIVSKYAGQIANPNDVIQFYRKGEVFQIRRDINGFENDCEHKELDIEDEMHEDDALRRFVNQNISSFCIEKNKSLYFNSDLFTDSLEKSVNGQERRSLELFFKTFSDNALSCSKLESNFLKELNVLENVKKDFSNIIDEIVDKDKLKELMHNNIKSTKFFEKKSLRNSEKNTKNSIEGIKTDTSINNNMSNDVKSSNNIRLTKVNNFEKEVKTNNTNNMVIDLENENNFNNINNLNNLSNSNTTINTQKVIKNNPKQTVTSYNTRSILDFVGKKSRSDSLNSAEMMDVQKNQLKSNKMEDIEEIVEDEGFVISIPGDDKVKGLKNSNNTFINNPNNAKKRKNFLIDDDKKNINKKNKKK